MALCFLSMINRQWFLRSQGSNLRSLAYKTCVLSTTPRRLPSLTLNDRNSEASNHDKTFDLWEIAQYV